MFEAINDRGISLKYFDKIKSFILYISNKYLNSELNKKISDVFENVYLLLDIEDYNVKINDDETLLLYHFLSNPILFQDFWSYTKSTANIYRDFKEHIQEKLSKNNIEETRTFIEEYLYDLDELIMAGNRINKKISDGELKYIEFFKLLSPGQRMYPVSLRLEVNGHLDTSMDILEKIEFYYKPRKDPKSDIFKTLDDICKDNTHTSRLLNVLLSKAHRDSYDLKLVFANDIGTTKYCLYLYNKEIFKQNIDLESYSSLEVEHIFPKKPSISQSNLKQMGFRDSNHYDEIIEEIGNKTLLEKDINSSGSNKDLKDKLNDVYPRSDIAMTNQINIKTKKDVLERSKELHKFVEDYFDTYKDDE